MRQSRRCRYIIFLTRKTSEVSQDVANHYNGYSFHRNENLQNSKVDRYFKKNNSLINFKWNLDMEYLLPAVLLWTSISVTLVQSADYTVDKYSPCPRKCDSSKCNKLSYCDGDIVKDRCGCCPRCSSDTWIHPKVSPVKQGTFHYLDTVMNTIIWVYFSLVAAVDKYNTTCFYTYLTEYLCFIVR